MVSCCSGGLAVRRAATWSYVLDVKEDAGQASSFTPSTYSSGAWNIQTEILCVLSGEYFHSV
jgi:hypothetical protein